MKNILTLFTVFTIFTNMYSYGQTKTDMVKGIRYSDRTAVSVEIYNDKIAGIKRLEANDDLSKIYLAPGLIDVQINGYMGVDFSGPDLTVEGIRKATKALWKAGVTSYFPTIITSDFNRMKKTLPFWQRPKKTLK